MIAARRCAMPSNLVGEGYGFHSALARFCGTSWSSRCRLHRQRGQVLENVLTIVFELFGLNALLCPLANTPKFCQPSLTPDSIKLNTVGGNCFISGQHGQGGCGTLPAHLMPCCHEAGADTCQSCRGCVPPNVSFSMLSRLHGPCSVIQIFRAGVCYMWQPWFENQV